jgi:electron transfer flavoprotein beta subunit
VSFAKQVELSDAGLVVQRQTDEGYEELRCPLPAVVSVTNGVVDVRYPSFKARMAAKSRLVETLTLADLGLNPAMLGARGARQEVLAVPVPPTPAGPGGMGGAFASVFGAVETSKAGNVITDEDSRAHEAIVAALESWNAI